MNIFNSIPKGDTRTWSDDPISLADGRVAKSSDWTLKYALRGPSSLDLTASVNGDGWSTTLTAAQSGALLEGAYVWAAILSSPSERITVTSGALTVTTDLSAVTGAFDGRTMAQKALADCEAALGTFKSTNGKVKKYEIAGRTMEFASIAELLQLHSFWQMKVLGEGSAAGAANGRPDPRTVYTRFRKV